MRKITGIIHVISVRVSYQVKESYPDSLLQNGLGLLSTNSTVFLLTMGCQEKREEFLRVSEKLPYPESRDHDPYKNVQ